MRKVTLFLAATVALLGATFAGLEWRQANINSRRVFAATSGGSVPSAQYLQAPSDGMAQYGASIQQSGSPSATLQALGDWNSYVVSRSEWGVGLTIVLLDRLATADWNARQAGAPQITPQQLANATSNLVNAKLATMTGSQQQSLFEQMVSVVTPKGRLGLNPDYSDASATPNGGGTWAATISADAFSRRKDFFKQYSPGMVSSSTNSYPGEAVLVFYSVAAGDIGFGGGYVTQVRNGISDLTGLNMTSEYLYGENGYLFRRPLSTFLSEQAMSQFFSELGF